MTLVEIPTSCPDSETIPRILVEKNVHIEELEKKGCTLLLCFTKTKRVIKKLLYLRSRLKFEILVFTWVWIGAGHIRAWITQCYNCQKFDHVVEKRTKKEDLPICAFCSGTYESRTSLNKSFPCCLNCSSFKSSSQSLMHYALSTQVPSNDISASEGYQK